MTEDEILAAIQTQLSGITSMKGLPAPQIDADTQLLDGGIGIDSLDLAVLVSEMEGIVGHDPFAHGFIEFHTAGELARLYAR